MAFCSSSARNSARDKLLLLDLQEDCHQNHWAEGYPNPEVCVKERRTRKVDEWEYPNPFCTAYSWSVCGGTDTLCESYDSQDMQRKCLQSHKKGFFWPPYSRGCIYVISASDERCVGTEEWCQLPHVAKLYGSNRACLLRRWGSPGRFKWRHKLHVTCDGADEMCVGTDIFCGLLEPPQRSMCFALRELAPYLMSNSEDCFRSGALDERCMGTDEWCHTYHQVLLYDEDACFAARGIYLRDFAKSWADQIATVVTNAITDSGANVTRNAVIRELVRVGEEDAVWQGVKKDVHDLLAQLDKEIYEVFDKSFQADISKYVSAQ